MQERYGRGPVAAGHAGDTEGQLVTDCRTSDLLPLGPRCHLPGRLSAHQISLSLSRFLSTSLDPQFPTPRCATEIHRNVTRHDGRLLSSLLFISNSAAISSGESAGSICRPSHFPLLFPSCFTPDGIETSGVEVVGIDTVVSSGAGIRVRVTRQGCLANADSAMQAMLDSRD